MNYQNTYEQRQSRLNNAEEVFKKYCKDRYPIIRFGFDEKCGRIESNFFMSIPKNIRSMPDYILFRPDRSLTSFFEIKGSRKIKTDDLEAYRFWNGIMPLMFFICNFDTNKIHIESFRQIESWIPASRRNHYPDNNKEYIDLDMSFSSPIGSISI